jgi:hypothetical protein
MVSNTGSTGNWGNTGTIGVAGPIGNTGVTGLTGMTGRTGMTGSVGQVGHVGPNATIKMTRTGPTGHIGVQGSEGPVSSFEGYTAQTGITGYAGNEGNVGLTAMDGTPGVEGDVEIGSFGFSGITGQTGMTGITGIAMTGPTGVTGITGYIGNTGIAGYTGITGYSNQTGCTGINGTTGYTGYYYTGQTGYIGNTGQDEYPIRSIPTIVSFEDDMTYTRQLLSRQMQENAYITDGALDILAMSRGYTQNETVYTFGKSKNATTYMATVASDASYGTIVSSNLKQWSPLQNASSNAPNRVIWDGTKWIVTRKDTASILYSYNAETFTSVDVSGATMASVATNSQIYVGIGAGGLFYGYDGLNWTNSTSGTSLLSNPNPSSAAQIGKVCWNGSLWVAVGNGSAYTIIYSLYGIHWSGVANSNALFDIAGGAVDLVWNGTIWVATGANSSGKLTATSYNGINWTNSNTVIL